MHTEIPVDNNQLLDELNVRHQDAGYILKKKKEEHELEQAKQREERRLLREQEKMALQQKRVKEKALMEALTQGR